MANSVFIWPGFFALNGTTINPAFPIAFPDGTSSAPSITFVSQTGFGFYKPADSQIILTDGGTKVMAFTTGSSLVLTANRGFNWSSSASDPLAGVDTQILRISGGVVGLPIVQFTGKVTSYNSVATAGWGLPSIYASGRAAAQTAAVASVCTYTVGAADGTFEIGANVLVTTATAHNFGIVVTYTDQGNTPRSLTLPVVQLTGSVIAAITNVTGAGPYEGVTCTIRCKAATAITITTAGTFTTVTYDVDGHIKQIT